MSDLEQARELVQLFEKSGCTKFIFKQDTFELYLEKGSVAGVVAAPAPVTVAAAPLSAALAPAVPETIPQAHKKAVTSPMIGTFYAAPAPGRPPFVKVGDRIEKGQVVCIIEAMKVMNEVKANVAGVVQEVLLDTGKSVEFGTELFRISE